MSVNVCLVVRAGTVIQDGHYNLSKEGLNVSQ